MLGGAMGKKSYQPMPLKRIKFWDFFDFFDFFFKNGPAYWVGGGGGLVVKKNPDSENIPILNCLSHDIGLRFQFKKKIVFDQ